MNELTLTEPIKEEGSNGQWIVYIVDVTDLCTGVAGHGSTPQEATRNAQDKIEAGKGELEDI